MMNQEIISIRTLVLAFFLSGLFLLLYTIVSFIDHREFITSCQEKTGSTYIIENTSGEQILISSASEKDILGCIGKALPFYDRTIEYVLIEKDSATDVLKERYALLEPLSRDLEDSDDMVARTDTYYRYMSQRKSIVLSYAKNVSPFHVASFLSDNQIDEIYLPPMTDTQRALVYKAIQNKDIVVTELHEGEVVRQVL